MEFVPPRPSCSHITAPVITSIETYRARRFEPGDVDRDGDGDFNELQLVLTNFGSTCP